MKRYLIGLEADLIKKRLWGRQKGDLNSDACLGLLQRQLRPKFAAFDAKKGLHIAHIGIAGE